MTTLEHVKQMALTLTPEEKQALARYLLEAVDQELTSSREDSALRSEEDEIRQRRMEWLKMHREEFAGQYVALSGDVLVGHGTTIREAHRQAKEKGVERPFLVRLTSENEVLFAGW